MSKEWRESSDVEHIALMLGELIEALPTKREYFAAAALTGLISQINGDFVPGTDLAVNAVEMADALIRELSKEPPE